jgi:methionyl-tRNA synthetase
LHEDILDYKDREMLDGFNRTTQKVETAIEQYRFREALFEVIDLARQGNRYMQEKEPWILAKSLQTQPDHQRLIDNCMHVCLQLCANLAILVNPFLPFTAKKMIHMMKVVEKMLDWENAGKTKLLSIGYSLREPQLLFRKIEDAEIEAQIGKLRANAKTAAAPLTTEKPAVDPEHAAMKPEIAYDDFAKLDLRTGIIRAAEKVEKADKLLKLTVDLGFETRTIVSGIAQHFVPDAIVGQQVVVVANLAPRKMRGIESQGMILMAESGDGKLHFLKSSKMIDAGSRVS